MIQENGIAGKNIESEIRKSEMYGKDIHAPCSEGGKTGVVMLYILFLVSIATMFVPVLFFAIISIVLFTLVMIFAAIMKRTALDDSLAKNHGIYISKTIWVTVFLAVLTTIPSVIYINTNIDITAMQPCSQTVADRIMVTGTASLEHVNISELSDLLQPCIAPFLKANHDVLINGVLIAFVLPVLYMALRSIKGFILALSGKSPKRPKSAI